MGNQKINQNHDDKVVIKKQVLITEFNVPMHCNACERSVAKTISKIKGVQKFLTDMPRHKVVVIGQINPEKVVKQIKKKTGKRAKIIQRKKDEDEDEEDEGSTKEEGKGEGLPAMTQDYYNLMETYVGYDCFLLDAQGYTIFSDENPNSCSVM